jgi:uncharacterized protein YggE
MCFSVENSQPTTIMSKVILIALAVLSSLHGKAQAKPILVFDNEIPHIEVTGKAERIIVPDEIYLSITIKERESGRDQITIEQQESDVKAALTRLNIPLESLTISDATADYVRVKWNRKDVVSQSEYELKLVEAQQVADVMGQLDSLKIKNAFLSRVSHSEIETMTKEVEIEAIQNAKEKADYLLEAVGEAADDE